VLNDVNNAFYLRGDWDEKDISTYPGQTLWTRRYNTLNRNIISSVCNCDLGWTVSLGAGVCKKCNAGEYKDLIGPSVCSTCPENSISFSASTALTDCVCTPGHWGADGGTCTVCGPVIHSPIITKLNQWFLYNGQYTYQDQYMGGDRYKNSNGMFLFKPCEACNYVLASSTEEGFVKIVQMYSENANTVDASGIKVDFVEKFTHPITDVVTWIWRYDALDSNVISPVCNCEKGWTPIRNICRGCISGKYKISIGNSECLDCPQFSNSLVGSTALTACTCNAGYTGVNGGTCTPCGAATYRPDTSAVCLNCPALSNSLIGSTALTDCICNAGYMGADGALCTACDSGKYSIPQI